MLEDGSLKVEELWDDFVIADLAENFQGTNIGSKCKVDDNLSNMWNEEYPETTRKVCHVDNLTRSGRVYRPTNLQSGEPSHPALKDKAPVVAEKSAQNDIKEALRKQLERTSALVCHIGHCLSNLKGTDNKLIHMLELIKVSPDITPNEIIALMRTAHPRLEVSFTNKICM